MFRKLGSSTSSHWKPKNPHSVEYLKYLHGVLTKNQTITDGNRILLVESLRALAEILIWGDQNDSAVFDFFLERQMLSHFLQIMRQKCGSYVCVQLLQTLNILFENIRHETSLYFLLSNNHVNSIITHKFNFNNEEIMAYYISFLKTLSFKLNPNTIHFFYNEVTQEFSLYTETVKYYNHNEAMVRIAVRTTTLNIYKVQDESMKRFIRAKSHDYFNALVDTIASSSIDIDLFARSAENESNNRERLSCLIEVFMDRIHYLNDIFLTEDNLSSLLSEILNKRLFASLYLPSLCSLRLNDSSILITPVSSLFFLSNFLLIVSDPQVVQSIISAIFFGDKADISVQWIRGANSPILSECLNVQNVSFSRIFFKSFMNLCNCDRTDHSTLYSILLIYAICQNKSVMNEVLIAAYGQFSDSKQEDSLLLALINVVECSAKSESVVRTITIELCCIVLRQLLLAMDSIEGGFNICKRMAEKVKAEIVMALTNFVYTEDLFLEMFEDEYFHFERGTLCIANICVDASLLLPPPNTPLSGVELSKRLPSGTEEKTRQLIQLFFNVRKFLNDLNGDAEIDLPLSVKSVTVVEVNDCINLANSDLLCCTVHMGKNVRVQRFLVADQMQLILVEPDSKRLGWAIVRFVGLLQDTHITGDPSDSRALHIIVNDVCTRFKRSSEPRLSARFVFDDHIRCMAAKQRLTKGRQRARQLKIELICDLMGIPKKDSQSALNRNPFRVVKGCAPGSIRRQQITRSPSSTKSSTNSLNIIPDDPKPESNSTNRNQHGIQDV